jgi:predicted type IV restriction endonuclease
MALRERNFKPVFDAMNRTLANIPGKLYDKSDYPKKEAYYHTVILTLLWSCGLDVHAEEWSSRGIADLVLKIEGDVYIIELKTTTTQAALKQIHDKGYAAKYSGTDATTGKPPAGIYLVGIAIDTENHLLKEYEIEQEKPA